MFSLDTFYNTDFGFLCPEFGSLSALTPFFLQVDHLMDSGEETRAIADILKNF